MVCLGVDGYKVSFKERNYFKEQNLTYELLSVSVKETSDVDEFCTDRGNRGKLGNGSH